MLTDVPGVRVGHWTNADAKTGCTVVVLPENTIASGEVRGGAPATREFALLDPLRLVAAVDAVVLSGGSAFGLAAADGVMGWLEKQGRGFPTKAGPVPIVVGMSLYDLTTGDGTIRPTAANGAQAAADASEGPHESGRIGAGTGATVGKWGGPDTTTPGGIGSATIRSGPVVVSALIAVNAIGWIDDGTTTTDPGPRWASAEADFGNTTIGIVVTNAKLTKADCHLAAQSGHDGFARALQPAHTSADGDALVVAATGTASVDQKAADPAHVRVLVQHAVVSAIRGLR